MAAITTMGVVLAAGLAAQTAWPGQPVTTGNIIAVRLTCKQVSTCAEAVALWCSGYRRADADRDGIPCETVCSSVEEVDALRAELGCP